MIGNRLECEFEPPAFVEITESEFITDREPPFDPSRFRTYGAPNATDFTGIASLFARTAPAGGGADGAAGGGEADLLEALEEAMERVLGGSNFEHGDVRRELGYLHEMHITRHDARFWSELDDAVGALVAGAERDAAAAAAARARFDHFCRLHRVLSLRLSGRNRTDGVSRFTNGPVIEPLALGHR